MTSDEAKKHFSYMYEDGFCKDDLMVGIDQIYNDHETQIKAKDEQITELTHTVSGLNEMYLEAKEEVERRFGLIKSLWEIVDDIDTYGDMAKSDDALFRSLVERKQKERWNLPISTDGYSIYLKEQIKRLKEEDKDTLFGLCRGGKVGGFIMYNINEAKKSRSILPCCFGKNDTKKSI